MKRITFSHADYEKFRRIREKLPFTARLLQVFLLQDIHVSDGFREYDTKFYVDDMVQYYLLEGRLWIVLLLESEDGLLFTTMRSATIAKLQYYKDAQGEQFQIVARSYAE